MKKRPSIALNKIPFLLSAIPFLLERVSRLESYNRSRDAIARRVLKKINRSNGTVKYVTGRPLGEEIVAVLKNRIASEGICKVSDVTGFSRNTLGRAARGGTLNYGTAIALRALLSGDGESIAEFAERTKRSPSAAFKFIQREEASQREGNTPRFKILRIGRSIRIRGA